MSRRSEHDNGDCDGGSGLLGCPVCREEDAEPCAGCGHPRDEHSGGRHGCISADLCPCYGFEAAS